MRSTCDYRSDMTTMIQIRNVPDPIHRQIKARAALAGMSMSDYLLRELEKLVERPDRRELLERIAALPEVELDPSPAEILAEERGSR